MGNLIEYYISNNLDERKFKIINNDIKNSLETRSNFVIDHIEASNFKNTWLA